MDLKRELELLDKTIESRQRFSGLLENNKEKLPQLVEIACNSENELSSRAISGIEFYSHDQLLEVTPYLPDLIKMGEITKDSGSRRNLAKMYSAILAEGLNRKQPLTSQKLEKLTSICFDWLIGNEPPAVKAFSMSALYYAGIKIGWVHPELKAILQQNIHKESKAYQARGKKILKKLE